MTRHETSSTRGPAGANKPGDGAGASAKPDRQRIAKAMARAGLCSRRDAEAWVLAGRVIVNGEVLTSPARDIGPDDAVEVDGRPLPLAEKTRLFLFHKPRGLVTSDYDPDGRETVADFLRDNWPEGPRTVTVGRLDINTEGLLLLTNDGGLARMLELPETGWLRRYRVRAKGATDQATLAALADGIEIDGVEYMGIEATLDRVQGSNCWLTMGLREGKNREIKRVLEHVGLAVNRLIRVSFGPFQLLDLPEGAVEEVRTRVLRDQLGESLSKAAGVDFGAPPERSESAAPISRGSDTRGTRAAPNGSAAGVGRSTTRDLFDDEETVRQRQDRAAGPRRHVSAMRASRPTSEEGPRRRIERAKTKDRHDRTVAVERVMSVEPTRSAAGRKHVSPSAEAKRTRVARSGGRPTGERRGSLGERGSRGDGEMRREWRDGPRRDARDDRRPDGAKRSGRWTGRSGADQRGSGASRGPGGRAGATRDDRSGTAVERPSRKGEGDRRFSDRGPRQADAGKRPYRDGGHGRKSDAQKHRASPNKDAARGPRPAGRPGGGPGRPPPRDGRPRPKR